MVQAGLPTITHTHSGTTAEAGNHNHTVTLPVWRGSDGNNNRAAWDGGDRQISDGATAWTSVAGNHTHTFTTANNSAVSSIYGNSNTVQPQTIKILYYIVVATSTKTGIQIDIDEIATDLNGKADVDLTNCTKPHIIETYVNGHSGYRVWSDGYCVQWGVVSTPVNLTFLKPFKDTQYNIVGTEFQGDDSCRAIKFNTNNMATSYIRITSSATPIGVAWRACGYVRV